MKCVHAEDGEKWVTNEIANKMFNGAADPKVTRPTVEIIVHPNDDGTLYCIITNPIREYRLSLGMTQNEFAKTLGVSRGTISSWENGGTPNVALIKSIYPSFQMCYTQTAKHIQELHRARLRKHYADSIGQHPEFAKYFKEQVKESNLTVSEVAKALDVSTTAVYLWKYGCVLPSKVNMQKIKKFFGEYKNKASAEKLSSLIKGIGISHKDFAKKVGISSGTVRNWVSGKTSVNWKKVYSAMGRKEFFCDLL